MTPAFRILADSVDVTEAIRDRLIDLSVIDEAGLQSDEVKLTLDDRRAESGAVAALPAIGTRLDVSLGYKETGLVMMGVYRVDEIEISSPPATLKVAARAAEMACPIRSPKTRSWDGVTLGDLVARIAGEHGLAPIVDGDLAGIALNHVDQTAESDLSLLTRLALHYDAIAKPAGDKLVFARRGQGKAATGRAMPTISLAPSQLTSWRYRHSARRPGGEGMSGTGAQEPPANPGGVKAYYWDFETGARREATAGKPPYTEIRHVFPSHDKALAAAQSGQKTGERHQGELSLTLPGDARLVAEARLSIALRPGIPTDWVVERAEHRFNAQGYVTQLECQRHA